VTSPPGEVRGSSGEQESCLVGGRLDLTPPGELTGREHRRLQLRAVSAEGRHLGRCDRLDDEVNVHRTASGMRPEAVVDLIGGRKLTGNGGGPPEQGTEFCRLVLAELPDRGDVALRLYDQRPDAEGPDAVLDEPEVGAMDETTGEITLAS